MRIRKNLKFIIIFVLLVAAAGAAVYHWRVDRQYITYEDHLKDTAVTVDDEDVSLEEMAFYIAYEELEVEKQAVIYDPEDTWKYWNMHTNGVFIKLSAKQAAMDMGIHDVLFEQLASEESIVLTEAEEQTVKEKAQSFWEELTEEQQDRIAVSENVIESSMHRIAIAQKYQTSLSEKNDIEYEKYEFDGDAYKAILNDHSYKVSGKIWDLLDFGNIILEH